MDAALRAALTRPGLPRTPELTPHMTADSTELGVIAPGTLSHMGPDVAKSRISLRSLNLLWAVPIAFAIGYFPAALVRFERCGLDACLGTVSGFASPLAPTAVGVAVVGALAMFGAVALVPWLRPARPRLAIAVVVAVLTFLYYVWAILFH